MNGSMKFPRLFAVAFLSVFLPFAAEAQQSSADPVFVLKQSLSEKEIAGETLKAPSAVNAAYEAHQWSLIWIQGDSLSSAGMALVEAIDDANQDGLNPTNYHSTVIDELVQKVKKFGDTSVVTDLDILLTDAFLAYAFHLNFGQVNPFTQKIKSFDSVQQESLVNLIIEASDSKQSLETVLESLFPDANYKQMRKGLQSYMKRLARADYAHIKEGGPKLKMGDIDVRMGQVRRRLQAEGYAAMTDSKDMDTYDSKLEGALKNYQKNNGLEMDGKLGPATLAALNVPLVDRVCQIRINMDRVRAFRTENLEQAVVVNLPNYHLDVYEEGKSVLDMKVIVGRKDRPTPLMQKQIEYVIMSPSWYVPQKIAVLDKLPILQKDPKYLANHNMKLFTEVNGHKEQVDPATVDWNHVTAKDFHYQIVQKPGDDNALGNIKFIFPNVDNVYMHDTSEPHLFVRNARSFSSGCVRLEKPLEMAKYVLKDLPEWTEEKIEKAVDAPNERRVELEKPLPVNLMYKTVWADSDGTMNFREDIYKIDKKLDPIFCSDKSEWTNRESNP